MLDKLPLEIFCMINEKVDIIGRASLRKVSKTLRKNMLHSRAHYEDVQLDLTKKRITLTVDSLKISWGCLPRVTVLEVHGRKWKTRPMNFIESAQMDMGILFSSRNTTIKNLTIYGFSPVELDYQFWEFFPVPMKVQKLFVAATGICHVQRAMEAVQPGVLKQLNVHFFVGHMRVPKLDVSIDPLFKLQQWKQLEEFVMEQGSIESSCFPFLAHLKISEVSGDPAAVDLVRLRDVSFCFKIVFFTIAFLQAVLTSETFQILKIDAHYNGLYQDYCAFDVLGGKNLVSDSETKKFINQIPNGGELLVKCSKKMCEFYRKC
ncbi:hypothetical protein CRE_22369 [Caenorhabditis remanei]|uniref:F-box domain-containing protein n=1 Tax=Caenorhabditis remanei TaxID=31234 RepID=E3MEC5_CAERE|nr:hypothetical protein CRE_22369 [Caenorhabditis remanei]